MSALLLAETFFLQAILLMPLLLWIVRRGRRPFSLRQLFLVVAASASIMGVVFVGFRVILRAAIYAAVQSAVGGRRLTREEARQITDRADLLPDEEFLATAD